MKIHPWHIAFLLLPVFFASCRQINIEDCVARVDDQYLYKSDLDGVVTLQGASHDDSVFVVHQYINNWIQEQLMVRKAKRNLTANQMNFQKELERLKNTLIINAYQNILVQQMIDTAVTMTEIEDYYEQNKAGFTLKNNIVRVQFVKINKKSKSKNKIEKLLFKSSPSGEDLLDLAELCEKEAENYFLESDKWLFFNEVLKEIPIETYDQETFLKNRKTMEIPDGDYIYYVNFRDFKIKDNISPLSFEKEKIARIIVNKRKTDLIDQLNREVLEEAYDKDLYEIY